LKIIPSHLRKNLFFLGFLSCLVLSALILSLSLLAPTFISDNYYQKSLTHLRKQAKAIKSEFASLISQTKQKQKSLSVTPFPKKKEDIFALFKKQNLDKAIEGIGYYDQQFNLTLWLGNVIDLKSVLYAAEKSSIELNDSSLLVKDKASVYLVFFQKINGHNYLVFYRLLAFVPHLQSPYLRLYQFIKPKLARHCLLEYRDFREDISGYEKLFARHQDEYIGQPQLQDKVQTIFFPLRNEKNKIIATITLRSPPLTAKISALKENIYLGFYLLLGISLILLLFYVIKTPSLYKSSQPGPILATILILIGLRAVFFLISSLEKIQTLPFFSPAESSFVSWGGLTKSPADIFLTSLFLFFLILSLRILAKKITEKSRRKTSFPLSLTVNIGSMAAAICLIFIFQALLFRLVLNSNLNLLRFSFNLSFLLLHFSLFLFFLSFSLAIFFMMRIASTFSSTLGLPILVFILEFGAYFWATRMSNYPFLFCLEACFILLIFFISFLPSWPKKRFVLFTSLLLSTLFIYSSLQTATSFRSKMLIQNSLHNIIKSQENWGKFLIRQSISQIEKRKDSIISLLHNQKPAETAHFIWENTSIAKFNWYSSLEIQAADGSLLSRFSLNVPILYRLDYELPLSPKWSILRQNIPFMRKEKDFLIAYKDWLEGQDYLGRTIIYLSIDYEMLPFLYSANPYFDLLRVSSIPSLNQLEGQDYLGRTIIYLSIDYEMLPFLYSANPYFDLLRVSSIPSLDQYSLGFAIYDLQGELLFNPNKISYGLSPFLLEKIISSPQPFWSSFHDKRKKYDCFYIRKDNRIYSLFLAQKNLYSYSVEFLKLFFLYLAFFFLFFILFLVLSGKRKIQNPFWSFAFLLWLLSRLFSLLFSPGIFSAVSSVSNLPKKLPSTPP